MMLRISIAVLACLPMLANAQWTNAPSVTNTPGSWTNTPGGGGTVPGPNVEPDTVKPGPTTDSWRRHVAQTGDAHGGIVQAPTNAAQTGWALRYSATGRPYYAPVQASDLITGYTTNQDNSITTNTALDSFNAHVGQTAEAHGGIMRSASNPGENGQVLLLNKATGRPYWGNPTIEGEVNVMITSGVARVNGRYATTNYTVAVSNGTWNGATAVLSPTGSLTIISSEPVSRWEYDSTTANGMSLLDQVELDTWTNQTHGLLDRADVYSLRINGMEMDAVPNPAGATNTVSITVSNLSLWTWGQPAATRSTNNFEGTTAMFDDPETDLNPVNLRTMQQRIDSVVNSMTPSHWSEYDATGAPNKVDGVNMGGRRVYLDSQWSLLGNGRYCALSYNGKDIFYISMSNRLLSVSGFNPGQIITINVSTNGVTSKPWIEWTTDLNAGNWMEITNATSTYPVKTNGSYVMTFSNIWNTAFFRAVQASSNVNSLVASIPIDAQGGLTLGNVTRTNWPTIIQPITNISQTSVIITNLTIQQGTSVNYVVSVDDSKWSTNQPFVSAFVWTNAGVNSTTTNGGIITAIVNTNSGSGGLAAMPATWDADSINTDQLHIAIGGMERVRFTTNGIIVTHGSLQLYEEDLDCNVRLYDGTRLVPSLTFEGHTNEWGLYARGYNGHTIAGWSVAGTEIGLLHAGGITLMDTNAGFYGRLVGDISGATGYPEPIFEGWRTNMQFSSLSISNLTIANGPINVKDSLLATRATLDTTGLTVKDAGAVIRNTVGGGKIDIKNSSGLLTTRLDTSLNLYDPSSGVTLLTLDNYSLTWKASNGYTLMVIDPANGYRAYDQGAYLMRSALNYSGITCYSASSQLVFSVDSQTSLRTICNDFGVTNSGNINMYGALGTNLLTITGISGSIRAMGTIAAGNLTVTNGGTLAFIDSTGTNRCNMQATTNGLTINGKLMLSTNYPSFTLTNVFNSVTTVLWYANGIVTNKTP